MQTLKKGSRGADVKKLQSYLNLIEDGIFGSITAEALLDFQREHNLVQDAVCGPKSWAALEAHAAKQCPVHDTSEPSSVSGLPALKKSTRRIDAIFLHCTATPEGKDYSVDTIRSWHTKPVSAGGRGWSDIGYHYVIYRDGSIHLGRDVNKIGAHVADHNAHSIGIVYVGGCEATKNAAGKYPSKDTRTTQQKEALVRLVNALLQLYGLKKTQVYGHYQYANKSCPAFKIEPFRNEL